MIKLLCKQDHFDKEKGIFNKVKYQEKIEGLTEGKTYVGCPVSEVSGEGNIGFGSVETHVRFLVFNDDKEWETYQLNLFEPI